MNIFEIKIKQTFIDGKYYRDVELTKGKKYRVYSLANECTRWLSHWNVGDVVLYTHIPGEEDSRVLRRNQASYIYSQDMERYKIVLEDYNG